MVHRSPPVIVDAWDRDSGERYNVYRRMAVEHLKAAGFEAPDATVQSLYQEFLPTKQEYDKDPGVFAPHYNSAMRMAAYLKIIKAAAGDDQETYHALFEAGRTEEGRMRNGGDEYIQAIARIPKYDPGSGARYFERFDEFPDHVHEAVYRRAFQMARERLRQDGQRASTASATAVVTPLRTERPVSHGSSAS